MKPPNATRILIVDDHEMLRRGVESIIKRNSLGGVCGEAQNGEEAIRKVQELQPDLVILDVSMLRDAGADALVVKTEAASNLAEVIKELHR